MLLILIQMILPQFKKMFKDFIVVQAPIDVEVGGLKAAYSRFNYSLQIPDGREFPTSSELWIVPRGDYFFIIGAGTRQDEKTGSRDEIRKTDFERHFPILRNDHHGKQDNNGKVLPKN